MKTIIAGYAILLSLLAVNWQITRERHAVPLGMTGDHLHILKGGAAFYGGP